MSIARGIIILICIIMAMIVTTGKGWSLKGHDHWQRLICACPQKRDAIQSVIRKKMMMALFVRLLLPAVFISVTTAVIQTSDGFTECKVPDNYSSIHHVHTNLSEGEFDLLQIEGLCFLFCTTEIYSIEVNTMMQQ